MYCWSPRYFGNTIIKILKGQINEKEESSCNIYAAKLITNPTVQPLLRVELLGYYTTNKKVTKKTQQQLVVHS